MTIPAHLLVLCGCLASISPSHIRNIISKGTLVMFTSNQHPSSLYKGGLSRDYFLPFIDLVVSRTVVLNFDGDLDYRREPKVGQIAWPLLASRRLMVPKEKQHPLARTTAA